jgi:hypothetical protein
VIGMEGVARGVQDGVWDADKTGLDLGERLVRGLGVVARVLCAADTRAHHRG